MGQKVEGKCIIFSAPSGAGKTTIVHAMLDCNENLAFSISACSRAPREYEVDGVDYHFISADEFREKIKNDEFVEWEEVYPNHFYGTLKSEVERLWAAGKIVVFDVDVYGGINLKKYFGDQALGVFILPPSIEVLEQRLRKRQTETEDKINLRLGKAMEELNLKDKFEFNLLNDDLQTAINTMYDKIKVFEEK